MDKDSQQMKNSVRAELERNQEGQTISHVSRTRVCHKLTRFSSRPPAWLVKFMLKSVRYAPFLQRSVK